MTRPARRAPMLALALVLVLALTLLPQGALGDRASTGSASGFSLDVIFIGNVNATYRPAFVDAANKWQTVITGDLPGTITLHRGDMCGNQMVPSTHVIDDVAVLASVAPIDGPGRTLGQAGPCITDGRVARIGSMQFDSVDVDGLIQDGTWTSVVLHEMGHVLGIGALWNFGQNDFSQCGSRGNPNYRNYDSPGVPTQAESGLNIISNNDSPTSFPQIELNGGVGTRCGHWDETTYTIELMTGYLDDSAPLSALTVGTLADLGFQVNFGAADCFPQFGQICPQSQLVTARLRGANSAAARGKLPMGNDILPMEMTVRAVNPYDSNGQPLMPATYGWKQEDGEWGPLS